MARESLIPYLVRFSLQLMDNSSVITIGENVSLKIEGSEEVSVSVSLQTYKECICNAYILEPHHLWLDIANDI